MSTTGGAVVRGDKMEILKQLAERALSLITEPVEYEQKGGYMATKRGKKFVKFDTQDGEVKIRLNRPEQAPAPAPLPPPPTPIPFGDYQSPRLSRKLPRITPKRPRLDF